MKMASPRGLHTGAIPADGHGTFEESRAAQPVAHSSSRVVPEPRRGSRLRYASTAVVPADHQFAYWQSLSLVPRIERARPHAGKAGFYGEALFSEPCHGMQFIQRCTDSLVWHFGWREPDHVVLVQLQHGSLHARHHRDVVTSIDARSGLVLCDRDRPAIFTGSGPVSMTYLRLPRAMVTEALGAVPIPAGEAVRRFSRPGPVMTALLDQLDAIIGLGARAGPADCAPSLELALHTVMTMLAKRNPRRWRLPEAYDDALVATTRYLLRRHSAEPDLTPERVARMVGCSRAHLYRQFSRTGETIVETLREARVQRARHLLATQPGTPVGAIAAQCGYSELSVFDRAFRSRFQITPREFRQRTREQATPVA